MIYFNSRHLSENLDINLAKWKRWVREFLPPDPLGGLQSGYARQFNLKEALRVYLGGQLLSQLRFSIPETRTILNELDPILKEHGYYALYPIKPTTHIEATWLFIYSMANNAFDYALIGQHAAALNPKSQFCRILKLSSIYNTFIKYVAD